LEERLPSIVDIVMVIGTPTLTTNKMILFCAGIPTLEKKGQVYI